EAAARLARSAAGHVVPRLQPRGARLQAGVPDLLGAGRADPAGGCGCSVGEIRLRVTVLLFARAREIAGGSSHHLVVGEGATPASVFAELCRRWPGLLSIRPALRCAVDQEYGDWEAGPRDGAEG